MRLIDADALIKIMIETLEALLKNPKMDNQEAHLLAAFHTVGKMIEDAPTADAVQVVRFKDCKHYREADPGHPDCDWCNRMICGTIRKGFFCADGERRSE